jgi:hypothetical protein
MQPSEFWALTGADFARYLDDLKEYADGET